MEFDMSVGSARVNEIVLSGASPRDGVGQLLDYCCQLVPKFDWDALRTLDFEADSVTLQDWLTAVLTEEPPSTAIVAYWFGLFEAELDDENTFLLYLAGAEEFDADDESGDWACDPPYFPEARYVQSAVLHSIYQHLDKGNDDVKEVGGYLLFLGYAALVIATIIPRIEPALLLGNTKLRHIAVGYDGGDFILLKPVIG